MSIDDKNNHPLIIWIPEEMSSFDHSIAWYEILSPKTFVIDPNLSIGLLAVCSEAKGLVGVKQHVNGISKDKIVPLLPGHIEEYNLKSDGKVSPGRPNRNACGDWTSPWMMIDRRCVR